MKKFLALALALLMLLSFAACSGNKDSENSTTDPSSDTTDSADVDTDADTAVDSGDTTEPSTEEDSTASSVIKPSATVKPSKPQTTVPDSSNNEPTTDKKYDLSETDPEKIIVSAKKEMIFTVQPTPACHASTVLPLDNGTVVAAWFAGTAEGEDDVNILTSVRSADGTWGTPIKVTADPDTAHWNPVLFQRTDGTIVLYFKVGTATDYWKTYYATSTNGRSWSTPRELVPGDNSGGIGPVKNKPLRLQNGTVLAPTSTEIDGEWKAHIDISYDDGRTWTKTPDINAGSVKMIQPTLWQSADGSVHMFTRTNSGKIYRSDSTDNGKTWSDAYATNIPNNNSGIDLDVDGAGRIFLAYNNTSIPGIRTPLSLAVSLDDGQTFTKILTFERGLAEYSYPAVVIKGDTIHITYTYERDYIAYWQIKIK